MSNNTIDSLSEKINKRFGKGTFFRPKDSAIQGIEKISTGSLKIDMALGGGMPLGRIVEVYGGESSGKTSLACQVMAEAQKLGHQVAFIDVEHALDTDYAEQLGVNMDNVHVSQPDCGEDALEILDMILDDGKIKVVVVDSVAALTPKKEIEGEMGDSVTFDTPIYVRNKTTKLLEIVPICSLYGGSKNFHGKRHVNRYLKTKSLEVLTHLGWKNLEAVFFKRNTNKKEIILTQTKNGYVKTTPDHCLFVKGKEVTANEIDEDTLLDIVESPITNEKCFYTKDLAFLLGLWIGDGSVVNKNKKNMNNYFSYNTIDPLLADRVKDLLEKTLQVSAKIVKKMPKGNRKPLYNITSTTDKTLQSFLQECCCVKSSLKKIPKWVLNSEENTKKSFIDGFFLADGSHHSTKYEKKYYNNSLPVIAGIQYILKNIKIESYITFSEKRYEQLTLSETKKIKKNNKVSRVIKTGHTPDYIYDIGTEAGTFVTALGNIVLHNSSMGLQARLMSQACRKITGKIGRANCLVIFINQTRMKIGLVFGNPVTTTGGNALKFYASQRLEVSRKKDDTLKDKDGNITGHTFKVKVVKNKVAPPFRTAECALIYGEGVSQREEIIDFATDMDILKKGGSWYKYNDVNIAQGRQNLRQFLEDNPEVYEEITKMVKEKLEIK